MPAIVFILFFSVALALRERALADPDTGWHIAAGDLIRGLGHLPASDPWSYTAGDQPWYNVSWAYDVGLSALYGLGGLPAVVVATIVLYALALALLNVVTLKVSQSVIAAFAVTLVSGFVLMSGMLARPQSLTFLLVVGFYAVLRFARPRQQWLLPVLMPVLMIVWANVHGGFLAGFVIIGAFFLEALLAKDFARSRRLFAIGALCGLAVLVNPYGWEVLAGARLTMTSALKAVILEWKPATIGAINPMSVYVGLFVLVSALYDRRIPLADKLLACFWLAMGIASVRLMQIAALLAAPYLAQGLALRLKGSPAGAFFARKDSDYAADLSRPVVAAVAAGLAVLLVGAALTGPVQRVLAGKEGVFAAFPSSLAPDGALDFLKARHRGLRLYNDYGFGGYLVFRERGAIPVFVDGRADTAYPRDLLKDTIDIGVIGDGRMAEPANEASWRALVAKHGIDAFLTSGHTRLYTMLSRLSGWAKVYEDDDAAVFVRADLAGS